MRIELEALAACGLSAHDTLQVYNGLDVLVTLELHSVLSGHLTPAAKKIYDFERELQGPVLDMMLRGIRIDRRKLRERVGFLTRERTRYQTLLNRFSNAIWGQDLNPDSPKQLSDFFYKAMKIPEVRVRVGREWKPSTNREALEKIGDYALAAPIASTILELRDIIGKIETLTRGLDPDGRMRCSYNIAGTVTGRFSSSKTIFRSGGNNQNWTEELRDIFIPDPGMKMAYVDLEQAESRAVGFIAREAIGEDTYLRSCLSGDLHTTVCRLVWPNLPWTGDNSKDKAVAESPFYRNYSYRDMAKRGGHGCLTEDHEVLTRRGWVSIAEQPNELLAWSPGSSQFEHVSCWTAFPYSGVLYELEGTAISARMTSEHRVPYYNKEGEALQVTTPRKGLKGRIPLGGGYLGGEHSRAPAYARVTSTKQNLQEVVDVPVLCPTVPSSFFYIRRNGKISVTGNSNYGGSAPVIASHLKITQSVASDFQEAYFSAFPEIRKWHEWVKETVRSTGSLTTPFGRYRQFFGRLSENKVMNEAIAYGPQSLVGDMLNAGMLRVFNHHLSGAPVELLMQVHDAILVQYPAEAEGEIIPLVCQALESPLEGTDFSIPSEAAVGWNWAKARGPRNPHGLIKWKGKDERKPPLLETSVDLGSLL